ncbi:hypothetical protein BW21_4912 [Burkholderia humptydooensis]|nr:hypothetical protein BW21_4912 [Burkholderia sp. 2002721687]
MHGLLGLQVVAVAQQQPAAGLQDLPGRPVMAQLISLIDPHPINHLTPVLGHDVEQVVDDLSLRTLRFDLQLVGRGHVDGHCFDALGNTRWKLFEEGSGRLARASRSNPEHLPTNRIDHHRGVAMTFMERELVHRQIADRRPVRISHTRSQAHLVDRFDRVPAQIVEGGDRLHAGRLQQFLAGLGKSLRHSLVTAQPRQFLQSRTAAAFAPDSARGTCSTTRYSNSGRSRTRRTVVS